MRTSARLRVAVLAAMAIQVLSACQGSSWTQQVPPRQPTGWNFDRVESAIAPPNDGSRFLSEADSAFSAGRYPEALALYEKAMTLVANSPDPYRVAIVLYGIGRTQFQLNRFDAANASFDRVLETAPTLYRGALEPILRKAKGDVFRAQGRPVPARAEFDIALAIYEAAGNEQAAARISAEIGSTYIDEANYSAALDYYETAWKKIDKSSAADVVRLLTNMSQLLNWLGEYSRALALQQQAAANCRPTADAECRALIYFAEGFTRYDMADYVGAVAATQSAIDLLPPDSALARARAFNNLGLALIALNRYGPGIQALQQSILLLRRVGTTKDLAAATDSLGTAYRASGDAVRSRSAYLEALGLWRLVENKDGEHETLGNLGLLYRDQGHPAAAILLLKLSVNLAQSLRWEARALDEDLQRSLGQRLFSTYHVLAGLLIDEGRLGEAQQVTAMLKEQELFEFVRGDRPVDPRQTRIERTESERKPAEQYDQVARAAAAAAELQELDARAAGAPLSEDDRARRTALKTRLEEADDRFKKYLTELGLAPLNTAAAAKAGLFVSTRSAEARLAEWAEVGDNTVLLQYLMLDDQLKIVLTVPNLQVGYSVPISRLDLNRLIGEAYRALQSKNDSNPTLSAQRLYASMFPPELVRDLDTTRAKTVMISLDGAMRYVPPAALHDGKRWLVERYAFVVYTGAVAAISDPSGPQWWVKAFGMTRAVEPFQALKSVRKELDGIIDHQGPPWSESFDDDFTLRSLEDAIDARPPVLHIASHFEFKAGTEIDSYLLLGDGSRMSLKTLGGYRFHNLDLLTLSACQTGFGGGRNDNGQEVESFGAMAQLNGAKSVLATLWKVDDSSTADLMVKFYRLRQTALRGSKAGALQAAQLELMHATDSANGPETHPFSHPYFWAPFVLFGDAH